FIFYYSTTFFQQSGVPPSPFINALITTLVNISPMAISLWAIERFGRPPLLIQSTALEPGTVDYILVVFVCIYIAFFASTRGAVA
ncbi:hypothetical protein BKA64DRAFT_578881, partial [Cadophora sp. MPI-SDFR-AT-0126]